MSRTTRKKPGVRGRPFTTKNARFHGRAGAAAIHAAGKTNTGPATEAAWQRLLDEVDPERKLSTRTRDMRARNLRVLRMHDLAKRSAEARRAKAAAS